MPRPKLLKIRLIYSVEGSTVPLELDIDPATTNALFLDEKAVVEILGGFYEGRKQTMTKDQAIARFGIRAEAWFPRGKDELPLNKAFMKLVWGKEGKRTARKSGVRLDARADPEYLPMLVRKTPTCIPSGDL